MDTPPPFPRIATHVELDQLSWHDATVHGVRLDAESRELCFDLDWPYYWLEPAVEGGVHRAWTAPATLVFHNVTHLQTNLEWPIDGEVIGISKDAPPSTCAGGCPELSTTPWWLVKGPAGFWLVAAAGFTQYVRRSPVLVTGGRLDLPQRGGISFERGLDATVVA
jgi:hypothetical protein